MLHGMAKISIWTNAMKKKERTKHATLERKYRCHVFPTEKGHLGDGVQCL